VLVVDVGMGIGIEAGEVLGALEVKVGGGYARRKRLRLPWLREAEADLLCHLCHHSSLTQYFSIVRTQFWNRYVINHGLSQPYFKSFQPRYLNSAPGPSQQGRCQVREYP
jgi:hypothetical protein